MGNEFRKHKDTLKNPPKTSPGSDCMYSNVTFRVLSHGTEIIFTPP